MWSYVFLFICSPSTASFLSNYFFSPSRFLSPLAGCDGGDTIDGTRKGVLWETESFNFDTIGGYVPTKEFCVCATFARPACMRPPIIKESNQHHTRRSSGPVGEVLVRSCVGVFSRSIGDDQ